MNARDRQGETSFHVAIENGHLQTGGVADVLLQHHADINAQDSLGYTSLLQVAHTLHHLPHTLIISSPPHSIIHTVNTLSTYPLNTPPTSPPFSHHPGGAWGGYKRGSVFVESWGSDQSPLFHRYAHTTLTPSPLPSHLYIMLSSSYLTYLLTLSLISHRTISDHTRGPPISP